MLSTVKQARTIDMAVEEALKELGATKEEVEIEVIEEGSKGIFGLGGSEPKVKVSLKDSNTKRAEVYLNNVLKKMGLETSLNTEEKDDKVSVEVSGDSMGIIIGRRGDTLDALQYLTSLVVNKGKEDYVRVSLDTENYRERREETLISLAKRMAARVYRSGKNFTLEPMNPNERRIIHSTLQGYRNVKTYSTGEEPNRSVVIALKEHAERRRCNENRYESKEEVKPKYTPDDDFDMTDVPTVWKKDESESVRPEKKASFEEYLASENL